jgi:uncharacterized DUF497 family protein
MAITFDPAKRELTLKTRGVDFVDAAKVFAGPTATWLDDRFDYGEARYLTVGFLAGRMVLIAWTPRGSSRRDLDEVLPCKRRKEAPSPFPGLALLGLAFRRRRTMICPKLQTTCSTAPSFESATR